MAKEKPTSFPMLPVKHWWALREKFKQTMPGTVTDNYLATILNVEVRSARANVLPYLRDIGLIDSEGKTQDLAKNWRDDKQYSVVCENIRKKLYPQDLMSAVEKPSEDREAVERWFANHTGAGSAAVKRMAAIYIVISQADLSKKPESKTKKDTPRKKAKTTKKTQQIKDSASSNNQHTHGQFIPPTTPGININLEIHISSDATPDQIDKIFESMARHIYKR
jgi:hypothetical protein